MSIDELMAQRGVIEREEMDSETAHSLERLVSRLAAVERYRIVRKYAHGVTVDAACGCGFGSAMLSRCPSVKRVIGLDRSKDALAFAAAEYPSADYFPVEFDTPSFGMILRDLSPDTVVSVETIEHLVDPEPFIEAVKASGASRFIVTFPSFPTSKFNPYHLNDVGAAEVRSMMGRWGLLKQFTLDDAVTIQVYSRCE